MKFSWKALILAPLLVPAVLGGLDALVATAGAQNPLFAFLFVFILGDIVSYGTTVFLFLPSLYVLSRLTRPTLRLTCVLGAVLGAVVYLPLLWEAWVSSGPDSGPPQDRFIDFALRFSADPIVLIFPLAGLITAAAYWLIANTPARDQRAKLAADGKPDSTRAID